MRWQSFTVSLVALGLCLPTEAAQKNSQSKAQKRDEQRENEAVRKAQQHVNDVQKDLKQDEGALRDAQGQLRQAITQKKMAIAALQKTIDRLEGEHADLTGLTATRRDLKAAQAAFDEKAGPVRKSLESQPEYQAALQSLAKIKAALKAMDDNPEADRKQLAKDFSAATTKVHDLERAAFQRNPELTMLQTKVDASEKAVQQALAKFEKAVEQDGDLKVARKALEQAQQAEDRAEDAVAKAARTVAAARVKLTQANQQLQQKKLQDAKDDNRGKNKNKNRRTLGQRRK